MISMKNMRILLLREINICQNNNFPKESTFFIDSLPEIRYIIDDYVSSENAVRRFLCLLQNVIFLTIFQEVKKWILP